MATGTTYQPGNTGAEWTDEVWSRTIEPAVYEAMQFLPTIKEYPKLDNKLHVRKAKVLAVQSLANTAAGDGITYSGNTEVEIELTPIARYVGVHLSKSQLAQMNLDPQNMIVTGVQDALAEGIDAAAAADVASLTTNLLGNAAAAITRPLLLNALQLIRQTGKMEAVPGKSTINFLCHPSQFDDFMSISEITAANVRGGNANPNVAGTVFDALGMRFIVSGNVVVDGNGANNVVYVPSAFGCSYNERIGVTRQVFELSNRIIGYVNFGHNIIWDERACAIRTDSA